MAVVGLKPLSDEMMLRLGVDSQKQALRRLC